nr:hypothetical protein BaRGS_029352 [Batillaria attramentaria]
MDTPGFDDTSTQHETIAREILDRAPGLTNAPLVPLGRRNGCNCRNRWNSRNGRNSSNSWNGCNGRNRWNSCSNWTGCNDWNSCNCWSNCSRWNSCSNRTGCNDWNSCNCWSNCNRWNSCGHRTGCNDRNSCNCLRNRNRGNRCNCLRSRNRWNRCSHWVCGGNRDSSVSSVYKERDEKHGESVCACVRTRAAATHMLEFAAVQVDAKAYSSTHGQW